MEQAVQLSAPPVENVPGEQGVWFSLLASQLYPGEHVVHDVALPVLYSPEHKNLAVK